MVQNSLLESAQNHLHELVEALPARCVGNPGNRAATRYFASVAASYRFAVQTPPFDCMDWSQQGAELLVNNKAYQVHVSPYTLGFHGKGKLSAASTVAELGGADLTNRILLLHGEIAQEQLMPKNFVFYNPDEHKQIIRLLEAKNPHAIIAATTCNPEMVGAVYPFPLIEDGDFDIPSVYTTAEEGQRLLEHVGRVASLDINARRQPAQGCNVIARRGTDFLQRVVVFAHIDAKQGTPGALDNATGCTILLLLAELLSDYSGQLGVELVALNGEDYYAAPGEMQYLAQNNGRFNEIILGINLDGVGYLHGKTAYSLYDCAQEMASRIRQVFGSSPQMCEGEPWYQGDHGLFIMNQCPALAVTCENFMELLMEIAHTPKDNLGLVDTRKLVDTAVCLRDLIYLLNQAMK